MELVPPKEVLRAQDRKWTPVTNSLIRSLQTGQQSQFVVHNHLGQNASGPVLKAKNFRLNIVFTSPVTVFWALVYVPEGMPIGNLNVTNIDDANTDLGSLYEPQQFLITSGLYTNTTSSVGGGAAGTPLRVWTPLARNLNPGDGIFFIWRATGTLTGQALMTVSYATCVN